MNPKTNKAAYYWIYVVIWFGADYRNSEAGNRNYCCEPTSIEFINKYKFQWQVIGLRLFIHLVVDPKVA